MKEIKKIINSDSGYDILDNSNCAGSTWSEGGCAILAQAINFLKGYPIYVIFNKKYKSPEHFGVKLPDGKMFDADGEHINEKSWLKFFKNNEIVRDGELIVLPFIKEMEIQGINFDETASKNLVKLLKDRINLKKEIRKTLKESFDDYWKDADESDRISDELYNLVKDKYNNSRIIMSANNDLVFKPKKQDLEPDTKPKGLWYGIGTSWIDWVKNEMPYWEKNNIFVIEIDDSKIIKISNENELLEFNEKYKIGNLSFSLIDWEKVSRDYKGIEIAPYLYKMRFDRRVFWYYGWDVASGCIWGDGVIKNIIKL
jgi:hypothetical protein